HDHIHAHFEIGGFGQRGLLNHSCGGDGDGILLPLGVVKGEAPAVDRINRSLNALKLTAVPVPVASTGSALSETLAGALEAACVRACRRRARARWSSRARPKAEAAGAIRSRRQN